MVCNKNSHSVAVVEVADASSTDEKDDSKIDSQEVKSNINMLLKSASNGNKK